MSPVIQVSQVHYPESDGKPMGETDEHREAMVRHIELLKYYFRDQQVYVSGDLLLYYEQGNPKKFVVPDAFVAKGLTSRTRRVYKVWVEGKVPDVVIETTSRKTRRKDTVDKPELYARLGVKEYFLLDPDQEYLDPPLQGYRREGTAYAPIPRDDAGCLVSQELELRLCIGEGLLQFYRLDTGERLLTGSERAELEAKRAKLEVERAEREAKRAEHEALRAEREAEGRRAAEAEIARLRAELARRPPPNQETS
jgi:Uma2 family endonuclease